MEMKCTHWDVALMVFGLGIFMLRGFDIPTKNRFNLSGIIYFRLQGKLLVIESLYLNCSGRNSSYTLN